MKKYLRLLTTILTLTLLMANSLTVMGAETEDLGSWTTLTSMSEGRKGMGVVEANGKIYAIGGYTTVEEYDPATDTWTTKADMPTARRYLGVAEVNGKIYAIGGIYGGYLSRRI